MIKTNKIMSRNVMYEPPMVEVIEVEVEKGFAGSLTGYAPDSDDSEFYY